MLLNANSHKCLAEKIMSQMSGLNVSAGYWHVKVDEASSDLLAFNTPFGHYKFQL